MSSSAASASSSSVDLGSVVARPKAKRVRKQKSEEDVEVKHEESVKDEQIDEPHVAAPVVAVVDDDSIAVAAPAKKRSKKSKDASSDAAPKEAAASSKSGSGYLSQETLNYYKQLAEVLDKDTFENEEDKTIFLTNVVDELCGTDAGTLRPATRRSASDSAEDAAMLDEQEANSRNPAFVLTRLCSHAKCSHLVQKILEVATPAQIAMFMTALKENIVDVLSDRYGSHVFESVLFRIPSLLLAETPSTSAPSSSSSSSSSSSAPDASRASLLAAQSRCEVAWKNIGTHSRSSVSFRGSSVDAPLRYHFFNVVTAIAGSYLELAQSAHASYSLRHIIHILQGETDIKSMMDQSASPHSNNNASSSSPSSSQTSAAKHLPAYLDGFEEMLPLICQELLVADDDALEAVARNASGVPVLQTLLHATSKLKSTYSATTNAIIDAQLQSMMAKLMQFKGDASQWVEENLTQTTKNFMSVMLADRSGSRLLETIFSLGCVELVCAIFACHMSGSGLAALSLHPISNFCVQHLLNCITRSFGSRGRHVLRAAYEALAPELHATLSAGKGGVVLKLFDACIRLQVKENKLYRLLAGLALASFPNPDESTSNPLGAILLTPLLKGPLADPEAISVVGALIVQSAMQPRRGLQPSLADADSSAATMQELVSSLPYANVVNTFLALPPAFMLRLATDAAGSHIFDIFVSSSCPCSLGTKQSLLRKFQMRWVDLSMSTSGSYVVERLFAIAPKQLKIGIAADMIRAEKRILGSRSGTVLYRKLRLEHFKRHQQSWLLSEDARARTITNMFDDVFNEGTAKDTASKQKKDGAHASTAASASASTSTSTKKKERKEKKAKVEVAVADEAVEDDAAKMSDE